MWLKRPSGSLRKWIGTSVVRRPMCTHLSTISEAYSQPCETQVHARERITRDAAHPAMDVGEAAAEHQVEDEGGDRRAEIAMQWRHRARLDRAFETRSNDELGAGAKRFDERRDLAKIIVQSASPMMTKRPRTCGIASI